jgi:flagellar basal-body rod modification protein FlgD
MTIASILPSSVSKAVSAASSILPSSLSQAVSAATGLNSTTAATTGAAASAAATAATAATASTAATTSTAATLTNPSSALNQQDFLQLLVAQIKYQDPMNPQSDTAMAAQLAQFTSLQQATQSSSSLAMMQAKGLVGSTVTVAVDAKDNASGVVSGVVLSNGVPQITVGGVNYNLSQITSITPATGGTTTASTQTTP